MVSSGSLEDASGESVQRLGEACIALDHISGGESKS